MALTLKRWQLFPFVAIAIFGPIGFGLFLYWWMGRMPEAPLDAEVKLDVHWIERGSSTERRLVPCVMIRNSSTEDWKNVVVGLNKQFYCPAAKALPQGESLPVPLEAFVSRNGSVEFPVGNRDVTLVTVFAQIANGARAVSEFDMRTVTTDQTATGWVRPEPRKGQPSGK